MELHKLKDISEPLAELNCRSGLMFYKLLCLMQANFTHENDHVNLDARHFESDKYENTCLKHLGYFIEEDNLFSS
jgi:hypothetical protein